jgi:phenylacetic acid degradation operon negative regulatory protein
VDALWQALEIDPQDPQGPQRIKALVVDPGFGAAGFARLAPVLDRLAQQGDARAAAILANNAEALAAMVAAVAAALELSQPPVCAMGGALTHLGGLRQRFGVALGRRLGQARLVGARGDACQGALLVAAERLQADEQIQAPHATATTSDLSPNQT